MGLQVLPKMNEAGSIADAGNDAYESLLVVLVLLGTMDLLLFFPSPGNASSTAYGNDSSCNAAPSTAHGNYDAGNDLGNAASHLFAGSTGKNGAASPSTVY